MLLAGSALGPAIASGEGWLDEMGTLDSQIALLKKRQELKYVQERAALGQNNGLPKIVAIHEVGGTMRAKLLYPDGRLVTVAENDPVLDGARVGAITSRGVMLVLGKTKGKSTLLPLDFAPIATAGSVPGMTSGAAPFIPAALLPPPPAIGLTTPMVGYQPQPSVAGTQSAAPQIQIAPAAVPQTGSPAR